MHKRKLLILLVALMSLAIVTGSLAAPVAVDNAPLTKQVAAPPEDIANLRLPDPAQKGVRSGAAMIPVYLEETGKGVWTWQGEALIDSGTQFSLLALAPELGQWQVTLQTPNGQALNARSVPSELGISGRSSYQGDLFVLENVAAEAVTVTVTAVSPRMNGGTGPDGYLVASSDSPYRSYAHLSGYDLLVGSEIGLTAYLYDADTAAKEGAPLPFPALQRRRSSALPDHRVRKQRLTWRMTAVTLMAQPEMALWADWCGPMKRAITPPRLC